MGKNHIAKRVVGHTSSMGVSSCLALSTTPICCQSLQPYFGTPNHPWMLACMWVRCLWFISCTLHCCSQFLSCSRPTKPFRIQCSGMAWMHSPGRSPCSSQAMRTQVYMPRGAAVYTFIHSAVCGNFTALQESCDHHQLSPKAVQ